MSKYRYHHFPNNPRRYTPPFLTKKQPNRPYNSVNKNKKYNNNKEDESPVDATISHKNKEDPKLNVSKKNRNYRLSTNQNSRFLRKPINSNTNKTRNLSTNCNSGKRQNLATNCRAKNNNVTKKKVDFSRLNPQYRFMPRKKQIYKPNNKCNVACQPCLNNIENCVDEYIDTDNIYDVMAKQDLLNAVNDNCCNIDSDYPIMNPYIDKEIYDFHPIETYLNKINVIVDYFRDIVCKEKTKNNKLAKHISDIICQNVILRKNYKKINRNLNVLTDYIDCKFDEIINYI